ncbi:hypothetical protein ABTX81_03260 [Kitasatospora sp. NPDC097605]|uniref:hypothetical protein n=1 Tax=Kitasatospora sp. NPDC097605 TaxID=3157226 RepID=UPI00332EDFDD
MLLPTTADLIEIVEVVRITDPHGWPAWEDSVPGDTIGIWEDAQEVLTQVAGIPPGVRMRCFIPGFALRARTGRHPVFPEQVLFEIAFCFDCRAVRLYGPAVTRDIAYQTFDPDSIEARDLRRRFQGCTRRPEGA